MQEKITYQLLPGTLVQLKRTIPVNNLVKVCILSTTSIFFYEEIRLRDQGQDTE